MSDTPIQIILVDNHKLVRQLWIDILQHNPLFNVIADCDVNDEAIIITKELKPDILIIDINMSPTKGYAVTKQVVEESPAVKVIGISVNSQSKYAIKMLELGAKGYFTKTSTLAEITEGIIEVYKGNEYICEEVRKFMPPSK